MFTIILTYARKLKFDQEPDYAYISDLIQNTKKNAKNRDGAPNVAE
jgi:hypothetical protein